MRHFRIAETALLAGAQCITLLLAAVEPAESQVQFSSDTFDEDSDLVVTGGTVITAQNVGGAGTDGQPPDHAWVDATVNGLLHLATNAGVTPAFAGAFADPMSFGALSLDAERMINQIVGAASVFEITVPGLTVGKIYFLQIYHGTENAGLEIGLHVEGTPSGTLFTTSSDLPRIIGATWIATDTTLNASLTSSGGAFLSGFSVQETSSDPPIAIDEDFSAMTLPSTFEISACCDTVTFDAANALFPGADVVGRSYLHTVGDAYNLVVGFIAEATVTIPGNQIAFMGFGPGEASGASNEPTLAPSIYARVHGLPAGGLVNIRDNGVNDVSAPGAAGAGTHRLRLVWDGLGERVLFQIHQNYTGGPFIASTTLGPVDGSDNGFSSTNSRIYFGSSESVTFDDVRVRLWERLFADGFESADTNAWSP